VFLWVTLIALIPFRVLDHADIKILGTEVRALLIISLKVHIQHINIIEGFANILLADITIPIYTLPDIAGHLCLKCILRLNLGILSSQLLTFKRCLDIHFVLSGMFSFLQWFRGTLLGLGQASEVALSASFKISFYLSLRLEANRERE
jgi:hypothetical protein